MTKDPDEVVYVPTKSSGSGPFRLHPDPGCPQLKKANSVKVHKRSEYGDDAEICKWCTGDVQHRSPGNDGLWKLLEQLGPDDVTGDDNE